MDAVRRFLALAAIALAGVVTLAASTDSPDAGLPLLVHRQIMMAMLGGGLLLSLVLPALRLPAVAAAVLSKATLVVVLVALMPAPWPRAGIEALLAALLVFAGAVFLHESRQEARWDSGLPLRQG